jgi:hypothetical protein
MSRIAGSSNGMVNGIDDTRAPLNTRATVVGVGLVAALHVMLPLENCGMPFKLTGTGLVSVIDPLDLAPNVGTIGVRLPSRFAAPMPLTVLRLAAEFGYRFCFAMSRYLSVLAIVGLKTLGCVPFSAGSDDGLGECC